MLGVYNCKFLFLFCSEWPWWIDNWLFEGILYSKIGLLVFYIDIGCTALGIAFNFRKNMIYFKEYRNASNVVNHVIILSPFLCSCSYDSVASLFRTILQIIWPNDLTYLLIRKEFPNSIWGYNDELMLRTNLKLHYFWFSAYSNRVSNLIS